MYLKAKVEYTKIYLIKDKGEFMFIIYFVFGILILLVVIVALIISQRDKKLVDLLIEKIIEKSEEKKDNFGSKLWDRFKFFIGLLQFTIIGIVIGLAISNMFAEYIVVGKNTVSVSVVGIFIAAISLFFTIYISMDNKKSSKLDSNVKFIQGLINNNYMILNKIDKESTRNILNDLKDEFKNQGNFQFRVSKVVSEKHEFKVGVKKKIKSKRLKNNSNKYEIAEFNDEITSIVKSGQKDYLRWLVTYYYVMDQDEYRKFTKNQKDKRFKHIINQSLTDSDLSALVGEVFAIIKDEIRVTPKSVCYNETYEIINNIYLKEYGNIGSFLRHSYRIVKYINRNINEKVLKQELLGMLRSYYSEDILLIIFYNAIFTETGLGFGRELLYSDFFGDKEDVENFDYPPHMRKASLAFLSIDEKSVETEIIKTIFIRGSSEKKIKKNMSKFEIEKNIKDNVQIKFDSFFKSK